MRLLAAVLFLAVIGCAGTPHQISPWDLPGSPVAESLARDCCSLQEGLLLRHLVRLRIPKYGLDQTFNGIMRFEGGGRSVRVVGMGGFGMKLFDLTIRPDALERHFMHPGLSRIPDMAEHIAFCVRRIWIGNQPTAQDSLRQVGETTHLYGKHEDLLVEHVFSGAVRTATRAHGHLEFWEILYLDYAEGTQVPRHIVFTDGRGRYELNVRLVEQRINE